MGNKTKFKKFIYSNYFIFILSLIIGFSFWLWISVEKSPVETKIITDVPVVINSDTTTLKEIGLKAYNNDELFVDVTLSGKKYELVNVSKDDIDVIADTKYVDSSGKKTLTLNAKVKSSDLEVTSLSEQYINIFFDKEVSKEINIKTKLDLKANKVVPDDCFIGDADLSQNKIIVKGPQSEIETISEIMAYVKIDKLLNKTTTFTPVLKIKGDNTYEYSVIDNDNVSITVPVMKKVKLPTIVTFVNIPKSLKTNTLNYSISSKKMSIALPIEDIDNVKSINVGTIDFSQISNSKSVFEFKTKDMPYDFLDKTKEVFVVFDLEGYETKEFEVSSSNIKVINNNSIKIPAKQKIKIKVVGKHADLKKISASNIKLEINLKGVVLSETQNSIKTDVFITGKGNEMIWAYGTYNIPVTIV